ncbi:MAG: 6-carboxytetrahydropterin synthase [Candidatus Rokubacteria bacterium]|nr:6-carboxytetrahydropterin synthase [Candidatus Rokubacteria bacterium]MBI4593119.1 6-carboxytetrahydropterin synthase [Candidatus Rokubacteria bacterium]
MSGVASSTRRFTFAAGHRYWVDAWPATENERVFGRLTVPHGHNYTVDVTVRGPIDETTGMVIDLGELKRIVGETVVERFDHADLNADAFFRSRVPTTENLAIAVWELLAPKLGPDRLWRVRVWEDPTLFVDYGGPPAC